MEEGRVSVMVEDDCENVVNWTEVWNFSYLLRKAIDLSSSVV